MLPTPMSIALAWLAVAASCASPSTPPAAAPAASPQVASPTPNVKSSSTSNQIQLVSFAFDPAAGLPEVPTDLSTPDPGVYLVQLAEASSPRGPDLEAIKLDLGLSLTEYIPNRAFREYLSPPDAERLRSDPRIRAVVGYLPAFKISRSLLSESTTDPDRVIDGLLVMASPKADLASLHAALSTLGAGTVTQPAVPAGYPPRFVIANAKASTVRAIANVHGTVWIEEVPRMNED